jgi:hypothetical protein
MTGNLRRDRQRIGHTETGLPHLALARLRGDGVARIADAKY